MVRFIHWEECYENVIDNYCKDGLGFIKETSINPYILECYINELKGEKDVFRLNRFKRVDTFKPIIINEELEVAYYGDASERECYGVLTNYLFKDGYSFLTAGYLLDNERIVIGAYDEKSLIISRVNVNRWREDLKNLTSLFGNKKTYGLANLINYLQ